MAETNRDHHGRTGIALIVFCFISASVFPSQVKASNSSTQKANLEQILEKTSAYCERVKQIALFYVCKENISDKKNHFSRITASSGMVREARAYSIRSTETQTFIYDYQLVKRDEEIKEQRILLEENGKECRVENAELEKIKYFSQYLALSDF